MMSFRAVLAAETQHGLAEVHDAIVGGRAGADQVDDGELRVLFEEHGDGARALRRFTRAAARVLGDIGADDDRLATGAVEREVADGAFHAVHAAEAGMLELGNFAAARDRLHAARDQGLVDHALDDNGARRIVGARLGAQAQEFHTCRIDVVLVDQAHDGIGRHCVHAVLRATHAEAATDNITDLRPLVSGPVAPIFQPYPVRRDVAGEAAYSYGSCGHWIHAGEST
jgi:hypothetical protein